MNLINRSPGAFICVAAVITCGVILIEAAMWISGSYVAMAATFSLIALTAAFICRAFLHLMEDEDGTGVPERVKAERAPHAHRLHLPARHRGAHPAAH
jgi:hypothetical protein